MEEEIRMNTKGFDEWDYDILERLKLDCRMSFRAISQQLGMPHTTVFSRVRRMEERGLIDFKVNLVPDKVGLSEGVILIKCPFGFLKVFVDELKNRGLIDLKQSDKGLLATFLFSDASYFKDMEDMMVYLDKTFGYPVEAFSVSETKTINNFSYIKKILKQNGSNKEGEYAKKGKSKDCK